MVRRSIIILISTMFFILTIAACTGPKPDSVPGDYEITPNQDVETETESNITSTSSPQPIIPTSTFTPEPSDTPSPSPTITNTATPTKPSNTLKFEWSIKTGELEFIGAAEDGTIYGIGENLYAIISNKGEVIQTNQIDLDECAVHPGGSGTRKTINDRNILSSNGVILSHPLSRWAVACAIYPDDPPKIAPEPGMKLYPFSEDGIYFKDYPEFDIPLSALGDITWNIDTQYSYWNDMRFWGSSIQINPENRSIYFENRNGEADAFQLPDDFLITPESTRNPDKDETVLLITPWDDVYLSYYAHDQLGNRTEKKTIKLTQNGNVETIASIPKDLLGFAAVTYLPNRGEIFFIDYSNNHLIRKNHNFETIVTYEFPNELQPIGSVEGELFIGYDFAFYIFDIEQKSLAKYSIIGEE